MNESIDSNEVRETVIIGAGPAGLQLAYFMQRAGRDYVVLEAGERPACFFEKFPRHGTLLSVNKIHTGRQEPDFKLRHDWNCLLTEPGDEMLFRDYSEEYFPTTDALVRYMGDFAKRFELKIQFDTRVAQVEKNASTGIFELTCVDGSVLHCKQLVVAIGMSKPHIPDIPGIELAEGYEDMSVDPKDFAGQTVLILGKGNSALETANKLIAHASYIHLSSPTPVKHAYNTHHVGHVRSTHGRFFDTYLLKSQNGILDGPTYSIERLPTGKFMVRWSAIHTEVSEEIEQFEYDRVLRCCGFSMDTSMFGESCTPELRSCGRLPALAGNWESKNVPGLFFAGTVMQAIDYKKSQSSFIHGFRYNTRTLFHLLEQKNHGVALPSDMVEFSPQAIAERVIHRANNCSSLWQQVGFLCDVMLLPEKGERSARWVYDLHQQLVQESEWAKDDSREYVVCMMTYGPGVGHPDFKGTAFDHPHVHPHSSDRSYGDLITEIHPVLRHYRGTELLSEYHVRSDFLTDWDSEFYRRPLDEFLQWDLFNGAKPQWVKPQRRELLRDSEMRFRDVLVDGVSLEELSKSVAAAE